MYTIVCCTIEFSVGFSQTEYTIHEGKNIILIVREYQGFIGGVAPAGVPVNRLTESFLSFFDIDSSADER